MFQSSPAPKSGCNKLRRNRSSRSWCFNPHPLRRADAIAHRWRFIRRKLVSILTRSEERMQFDDTFCRTMSNVFQSSPAPKSGCNLDRLVRLTNGCGFNPHPLRRADAIIYGYRGQDRRRVSILTRSEERMQSNVLFRLKSSIMFQSSPAPKSGCNPTHLQRSFHSQTCFNPHPLRRADAMTMTVLYSCDYTMVSILTRSEERMQCGCIIAERVNSGFQSSPAPKSGCNRGIG